MSAVSFSSPSQRGNLNTQDAFNQIVTSDRLLQFPNRELLSHVNYWFCTIRGNQWESWVTENVRFSLMEAGKLSESASIEAYGEATFPHLSPDELIALYRLLNSHSVSGDRRLMIEGGALAERLVANLEEYMTNTIVWTRPAVAAELSQVLLTYDQNANLGHLLPKLTSRLTEDSKPIIGIPLRANNCWALSAMQMVQHLPSFRTALMENPEFNEPKYEPFKAFVREYTRAQETLGYEPQIDLQAIRLALEHRGISPEPGESADAAEALNFLIEGLRPGRSVANLIKITNQSSELSMPLGIISLPIVFADEKPIPFMELFLSYFDEEPSSFIDEQGQQKMRFENRRFHQTPNEFVVQLMRLAYGPNGYYKIHNSIDVAPNMQLPGHLTISGEGAQYECDMFIRHMHDADNGHYFIYFKRPDGWWKADNEKVEKVEDGYAVKKMHESTIFHFKKV